MRLTFVWQDCVVVGTKNTNIMTDPSFPRIMRIVSLDDLPSLDAIVLSNPSVDDASWKVLEPLRRTIPVIVPRGIEKRIRRHGFVNVTEVQSGKTFAIGEIKVTTVPAKNSKGSFGVLFSCEKNVFFAGPTRLFDEMAAIGRTYQIDLVLLPIGGRMSGRQQRVMTPEEAAKAAASLKAKSVVPIHWHPVRVGETEIRPAGTPKDFHDVLTEKRIRTRVRILRPSDTIII